MEETIRDWLRAAVQKREQRSRSNGQRSRDGAGPQIDPRIVRRPTDSPRSGTQSPISTPVAPELLLQADAAIRGAAEVVSMGLADPVAAGVETLLHSRRLQDMPRNFRSNLNAERSIDSFDMHRRAPARLGGEAAGVAILARGGARGGANWSSGLPSMQKGHLGDALSALRTIAEGDIPVARQVRIPLRLRHTVADLTTLRRRIIEAKFGPTASLSPAQRRAVRELLARYRVDWWMPRDVGRLTGASAGSAGAASAVRSNQDR